jgi:hypothetical protein
MRRIDDEPEADGRTHGVFRIEQVGEYPLRYRSLIEATREPPRSVESQILGCEGVLAEAFEPGLPWAITTLGRARISREANGRAA